MRVELDEHALKRAALRGATVEEIVETVASGESLPARKGRSSFRRNFAKDCTWQGRRFSGKQLKGIAVDKGDHWLAITVILRYLGKGST
jgi:hypothetical protein